MSWIGGYVVIKNESDKEMKRAKGTIRESVRHNADLEEFPNMGDYLNPIKKLSNKVFVGKDDAMKYIESLQSKWGREYNPYVEFIDISQAKETKKMQSIKERLENTQKKKADYIKKEHMINHKSSLIGCKRCGSKIAREYLIHTDYCPVCRNDLRSDTVLNTIKRYDEIINELNKELINEKAKQKEKCPHLFLIGYEEYVG